MTAPGERRTDAVVVPLHRPDRTAEADAPAAGPTGAEARPNQRTSSSVLMAAMLGLADAMGFERPRTELVTMAEAHTGEGDDALIISFGPLDPLD